MARVSKTGARPSISIPSTNARSPRWSAGGANRPKRTILVARVVWLLTALFGEIFTFALHVRQCGWPEGDPAVKLLIVSDPQIPDWRSYPGRGLVLRWLGEAVIDNYLRKSWKMVKGRHRPDAVIFLGDLLDSGVLATDRFEHARYVQRFRSTFPLPDAPVQTFYVPGNHDLGLYLPPAQAAHAREQFKDAFGPLNGVVEVGSHRLIWIDSMAYLEERAEAARLGITLTPPGGPSTFIHEIEHSGTGPLPRILFSHIPLWRPEGTSCGPRRESKRTMYQGRGVNYQNLLDQRATEVLLEQVAPEIVYSGDDHDGCEVRHPVQSAASFTSEVPEITVKAFSMAMGVSSPGYELVTLLDPATLDPSQSTVLSTQCLLPSQLAIYLQLYLPFALITFALVFFPKLYRSLTSRRFASARANGLPIHGRSHSRTLSRALGRRPNTLAEESDEDALSDVEETMFGQSYPHNGPEYSYHSSHDEDGLPTPATTTFGHGITRARPGGKVRRVSRVWLWEQRSGQGDDDLYPWLSRLGPVNKYFIRPIYRIIRAIIRRVWTPKLSFWWSRMSGNAMIADTLRELWTIAWPALALTVVVWAWYL